MALFKEDKLNDALNKMGIYSDFTALNHFPRKYEDYRITEDENHLFEGQRLVVMGHIIGEIELLNTYKTVGMRFTFKSLKGNTFVFVAFGRVYLSNQETGEDHLYTISGFVSLKKRTVAFEKIFKGEIKEEDYLEGVYSLPKEIPNYRYRLLIKNIIKRTQGKIYDLIPQDFITRNNLLSKEEVYQKIHLPKNEKDVSEAINTLKYEEALFFSLKSILNKEQTRRERVNLNTDENHKKAIWELFNNLPFELTNSQRKAVRDIYNDLNSPFLMNRLLQGDVGSGKTLVASIALYLNYLNKQQGAFMVPSDTLARQHFDTLNNLFKNFPIRIALFVGSLTPKEKRDLLEKLARGDVDIVIGTHALFSPKVNYHKLGMIIIDEQHRFGTLQRSELVNKSDSADILMMSATPIPRTLSLGMFGELDVSVIDENPLGAERDVETRIYPYNSERIDTLINSSLNENKRVFIIAPKINDENANVNVEQLFELYQSKYPNKIGLLHGKVKKAEQIEAMEKFRDGITPILISTSIVEVGIDIRNANLMLVYGASNFGLASLHQLRGRIGRDGSPSYFILLSEENENQKQQQRLNIIQSTTSGAIIAQKDLKMRGSGEIEGIKQSGSKDYIYLDPVFDQELLKKAKTDATYILNHAYERNYQYIINRALESLKNVTKAV